MSPTRTPISRNRPSRNRFDAARTKVASLEGVSDRRWGIYVRISQDAAGEGLGVARQEHDCRELGASKGGKIVDVFSDNDVSAWSGKHRPGYEAMLDAARQGAINGVIVYNLDRLTRRPIELEEFMILAEDCQLELANVSGEIDLSNHYGQMMARVRGAVARAASDDASMRIRRKMQELRENGKSTGGGRFYGWTLACASTGCTHETHRRMQIVPDEAKIIQECSQRVIAGESINSITRELNRRGSTTSRGRPWDRKTVRNMLLRARNAGLVERRAPGGGMEVVARATDWDGIVDEETWRSACVILQDSSRLRHYTSNKVRHLLSTIATCGGCGDIMIAGIAKSKWTTSDGTIKETTRRIYKCRTGGSGCTARNKEPIDLLVTEAVIARIEASDPAALLRAHLDEEQVELEGQVSSIKAQMKELAQALGDEAMTMSQFRISNARLLERLNALELLREPVRQEQVLRDFVTGESVRATWDALGVDRQRAVVRALIASLVIKKVGKGKGNAPFDPESVELIWR
jgi:DNA invertase Pin-like site-specific DNA recombinase